MTRTQSKGIIFDCDGTLVNSLDQAMESFVYALEKVGEGHRTPAEIKSYFGSAADRILMRLLGDEDKALSAFEHYLEHQTELAHTTRLHSGVQQLLETLAKNDVPLSVVTGRHARDLEILLKPHKMSEYFVTLVADSLLPHSKPAPDGILLAAERMGLPPERTMYVGDSTVDMRAAHAAGAVPVAALWDEMARREELAREEPTYYAETPADVWSVFQRHFSS